MQNKARVKPDQPTNSIFRSFCWDLPGTTGFASISFLVDLLFRNSQNSDDVDALSRDSVATTIYKRIHEYGGSEREWICNAIDSLLKMEVDIQRKRRILRIPTTILEPGFLSELNSGASLWDLRRFSFLSPMILIVENDLDTIITVKELLKES